MELRSSVYSFTCPFILSASLFETLHQLCEPVEPPKSLEKYIKYFVGNVEDNDALKANEEKRLTLYKAVVALIRAYNNIAPEIIEAGYSFYRMLSSSVSRGHGTT